MPNEPRTWHDTTHDFMHLTETRKDDVAREVGIMRRPAVTILQIDKRFLKEVLAAGKGEALDAAVRAAARDAYRESWHNLLHGDAHNVEPFFEGLAKGSPAYCLFAERLMAFARNNPGVFMHSRSGEPA